MANTGEHILIVAGEASGDLHGAHLVRALKQQSPQLEICGVGGSHLTTEGVTLLGSSDELAVVGVFEVVKKLKTVWRVYKQLSRYLNEHRPDVLILIDYPEFNLRLARVAHRLGLPIVYYISPQVWAWRSNRVKLIRRLVTKMIVIFPFEQAFYKSHGVDVEWVGHPLVESVRPSQSKDVFCRQHELNPTQPIIGLLPGSRESEVERLLPMMLEAAQRIYAQKPEVQFVLPLAASLEQSALFQTALPSFVRLVRQQTYDAIHAADLVVTASGTVTVETAILETPMIITYIVSPLTYWLGRLFINVPFIGMVNLIANKQIVKELIQTQVTSEAIAQEVLTLLEHPEQLEIIRQDLRVVRQKLGETGAAERAAAVILDVLKKYGRDLS
ncbi:lipid-A-disaccharide synthase [Candidatus Vecturithrix granuli]|uniref:Lipid-A-disaccharide synthase n=1 Tax=Vecturithrix granuli TaxID=1499967 RepID=A0A081C9A0_VECG1|nr:lipid-A-disaccharide synthase [Candidatus Vecturithrix granuli]